MVKSFRVSIIGLFLVGFCISGAWAAESPWKNIGEKNGIVGFTRATTRSSVDEMKAIGIVDAPVAAIEALIRDIPAETEWMYKCNEATVINTPEFKSGGDIIYVYNVTDMPMPVSDRDAVAKAVYTIDKATGTVYIHVTNVQTTYKLDKKKVRMPLVDVSYTLVPKGADKTEVTYTALADPGGNLPSFVVNMLTKNLSIETVAGIRSMVKKDKYKNIKNVVTTTPH
ncbi:MAG: START domain-containing protein [Syntrophaceae bacterium]